jgi:uncharacterized protein YndB with AHSA1/START domain
MMGENQMDDQKLIFEQYIQAPISQIYLAFTNSTALREWLCDIATVDPGGSTLPGIRVITPAVNIRK